MIVAAKGNGPQALYHDTAHQPQVFEASELGSVHEAPNNGIIIH